MELPGDSITSGEMARPGRLARAAGFALCSPILKPVQHLLKTSGKDLAAGYDWISGTPLNSRSSSEREPELPGRAVLMSNKTVSYYRDRRNPEAVHFPAQLHVAATYALILIALVLTGVLTLIYDHGMKALTDLAELLACLAFIAFYYPKKITTDETGVRIGSLFGLRKRLIRWDEIQSVKERAIVYGIPPFDAGFVANWVVVIRSVLGGRPVRFTCRHSGRRAFLYELKRWGAPEPVLRRPLDPEALKRASRASAE